LATTSSDVACVRGPPFIDAFIAICAWGDLPSGLAIGVGSKEEALTLMGRSHVRCRYDSPLRVEPCLGQVTEDFAKDVPSEESKDVWALLHDAHAWS
jgi:hypothetical protein